MIGRLGPGRRVRVMSIPVSVALAVLVSAVATAHPLGNFTINHYAALTVGRKVVGLDVVLDYAEIPTFTERQRIDTNGDGTVSPAEIEAEREAACPRLAPSLELTVDARRVVLRATAAGLWFPPGAGGLPTMRVVCEFQATLPVPIDAQTPIAFADTSYAERVGWREITMAGDRVSLAPDADTPIPPTTSVSARLSHYPADLLSQPLDQRSAQVVATPGGGPADSFTAGDASPIAARAAVTTVARADRVAGSAESVVAAVPGGAGQGLDGLLGARDLTPAVVVTSLLIALALGAAHAVSPGHGKTVMAAYLVGSQGTGRQAIVLGLTVTVSHTLGVLALATITLLASNVLPPERLYPVLGVASGLLVVAIGVSLLLSRLRRGTHEHTHPHPHPTPEPGGLAHPHKHSGHWDDAGHTGSDHHHERSFAWDHGLHESQDHQHGREHVLEAGPSLSPLPISGHSPLRVRRLVALGLAGGLVPSASAILLLLGSLAAGRPLFGFVLVVAFGAGMALVLAGLGLALVRASALVERVSKRRWMGNIQRWMPLGTAVVVLVAGIVLTGEAIHPTL